MTNIMKITRAKPGDVVRATMRADVAALRLALAAGGDQEEESLEGISSLAIAACQGSLDMVKALMKAGADPGRRICARKGGLRYLTALDYVFQVGGDLDERYVFQVGGDLDARPRMSEKCKWLLLRAAVDRKDQEAISGTAARLANMHWKGKLTKTRVADAEMVGGFMDDPDALRTAAPNPSGDAIHENQNMLGSAVLWRDEAFWGVALRLCDPRKPCLYDPHHRNRKASSPGALRTGMQLAKEMGGSGWRWPTMR